MPTPLEMLAGFGVAKAFDYIATEKQQSNYEQNQKSQQQFTRQMAVDSTPLAALGMRKAGLNPATMSAPLSPVSAPSVSHGAAIPTDVTPLVQLASLEIQKEQAYAEIDKINAETQHQRIINTRELTADEDYSQAIIDRLEENKKMFESIGYDVSGLQADIDRLKENPANLGTFTANMAAIESSSKTMSAFVDKLSNLVRFLVDNKLIKNDEALSEMSKKDSRESVLLARKIGTEIAQKYYLTAETEKSKEQINNLKKEQQKIDAEIDNLGSSSAHLRALANKVANEDVNTLISNGEFKKAFTAEMVRGGESFLKGFGQGTGLVAGARAFGLNPAGMTPTALSKLPLPQTVGSTGLQKVAKTSGKVADKLSNVDKKVYSDLVQYYGKKNANHYLNGYLKSNYKSFNSYLDSMQKMAKTKR